MRRVDLQAGVARRRGRESVRETPSPGDPSPASRGAPAMTDRYADEGDDLMSRATDLPTPRPTPRIGAPDLRGKQVCPFCGSVNTIPEGDPAAQGAPCPRCSMSDTPATRKATKARIGPWFVRQTRNPAAPGMRFDTLLALVRRGQVTAQSVVRGPTTHQLWRFAAQVKGLSRAFGVCYSCGGSVEPDATLCTHCNRMQEPPLNPDVLLETALASVGEHQAVRRDLRPAEPPPAAPAPSRPGPAPAPPVSSAPPQPDIFSPADQLPEDAVAGGHPLDQAISEPPAQRREQARPRRAERERDYPRSEPRPPERQRQAPNDSAILSAADLAAAFQLDFQPRKHPRRKWVGKTIAALLLLSLGTAAVVLMGNDSLRSTVLTWGQQQYATIREAVVSRVQPAPMAQQPTTAPADVDRPSDITPPRTVARRETPPAPLAAPTTRPAGPSTKRAPNVVATAPAPTEAIVSPAPRIEPLRNRPVAAAPPPPQQPVSQPPPQPAPIDPAVAADEARTLWRQAIDAEARQDFAAAVQHYEQIKKLPRSAWPGGLEINLDLARQRLKSSAS